MFRKLAISGAALLAAGGAAIGADLPTRKGPPLAPVVAPYNWTGFYLGADVGGAWGSGRQTFSNGAPTGDSNPGGVIGGGYVGYNQQFSQFVVGLEGDVAASSVKGSFVNLSGIGSVGGASFDWEGAIRARAGMAWDRALVYVAGGVAFADFAYKGGPAPGPACCGFSDSRAGFTIGGGVEYAFTDNLIARVEYRFNDFGAAQGGLSPIFPTVIAKVNNDYSEVRAGLEWKFGTARY
jgi:outer membrane immunogenic protein